MKKVLFINGHLNAGGCERSLVDVLKHLDYNRYQVDLLLLEELGDYAGEIPKEVKVHVQSLNNAFGSMLGCIKKAIRKKDCFSLLFRVVYLLSTKVSVRFLCMARVLFPDLQKEYDVVIAYRPGICTDLAAYTFKGKRKISWWHHGEMHYATDAIKQLKKAYEKMGKVVAVSKCSAELLKQTFPEISDKLVIIPNMICPEELKQKATQAHIAKDMEDVLKFVTVGRMSPEKNMCFCTEIAKELKKKRTAFKWYIIGDGEQYTELEKKVAEYDLHREVVLLGKLENPYAYIQMADIMLHPSLVESQGITVLESMALGTGVIAVASAGVKEFLVSGGNGYLVEPDTTEVIQLVEKLCKNPSLKEQITKAAKQTTKLFESEQIMERIYEMMET